VAVRDLSHWVERCRRVLRLERWVKDTLTEYERSYVVLFEVGDVCEVTESIDIYDPRLTHKEIKNIKQQVENDVTLLKNRVRMLR
jgi:hypothetical protein